MIDLKHMSIPEMVRAVEQLKADLGLVAGRVWISTFNEIWDNVEVTSGFDLILHLSDYVEDHKIRAIKMLREWGNIGVEGMERPGHLGLREAKNFINDLIFSGTTLPFLVDVSLADAQLAMDTIGNEYDLYIEPNVSKTF